MEEGKHLPEDQNPPFSNTHHADCPAWARDVDAAQIGY
ncbi:unnamed protein product, partial [Didymodactylos carnosus]